MNSSPSPQITRELVESLELDDLYDGEMVLYNYCIEAWGEDSDDGYLSQELAMLKKVPRKLGFYYLVFRFEALCGEGGIRAVAVEYSPEENAEILRLTGDALRCFGDSKTAVLIDQLVPVSLSVSAKVSELEARNATDPELEAASRPVDVFDARFEEARQNYDIFMPVLEDMHRHPEDYIP